MHHKKALYILHIINLHYLCEQTIFFVNKVIKLQIEEVFRH